MPKVALSFLRQTVDLQAELVVDHVYTHARPQERIYRVSEEFNRNVTIRKGRASGS